MDSSDSPVAGHPATGEPHAGRHRAVPGRPASYYWKFALALAALTVLVVTGLLWFAAP